MTQGYHSITRMAVSSQSLLSRFVFLVSDTYDLSTVEGEIL